MQSILNTPLDLTVIQINADLEVLSDQNQSNFIASQSIYISTEQKLRRRPTAKGFLVGSDNVSMAKHHKKRRRNKSLCSGDRVVLLRIFAI